VKRKKKRKEKGQMSWQRQHDRVEVSEGREEGMHVRGRSAKEKKRRKKDKQAGCSVVPRVHEQKDVACGFKKR
jgi:hypothetical protein